MNKETPFFKKLQKELTSYLPALSKAADVILDQGVSSYPIFVIHKQTPDIGINIVDREKISGEWSVNASTLEEFVTKQLIEPEKVNDFKAVYKNPEVELCLFVLNELGANFVFMPRS